MPASPSRTPLRAACRLLLVLLAACGGGDGAAPTGAPSASGSSAAPAAVRVVSGAGQSGDPGSTLATPLVVQVSSASGAPVAGVPVTFVVSSGSATVTTGTAVTDAAGRAQTQVVLGSVAGPVQVTASVAGTSLTTTLGATIAATATACDPATAGTLTPGQVMAPAGTTLCVNGGATGGEFALVAFNAATTPRSRSAFVVRPTGIETVSGAPLRPSANVLDGRRALLAAIGQRPAGAAFGARVREAAARELRPRFGAARGWLASRGTAAEGPRRAVIPGNVSVGQLVTLNANGDVACSRPDNRVSRVAAVSNRAIVVADTTNPMGGFTDADYAAIAATFDTLVYAVDVRNFGAPTDIDGNGKVVLYYTAAVNALTPKNSDFYIGGFFTPRDLFPTRGTSASPDACAASNVAEMFYLLVPDPGGMINGNRYSKSFVTNVTIATVAHEFEHLINASRRLYVNTSADDYEATWLDEGLAHVAEELVFLARTGLQPRQNLDATMLRSTPPIATAFTEQAIDNFDRLGLFLEGPTRNSPYADDDSLATRGATWAFLRYAADQQQATAQETLWQRLVNGTASGLPNLHAVFGTDVATRFRDWATMLLMDDVPGADARFQMLSWNLRSVFAAIDGSGTYPLQTTALVSGSSSTASILAGGAAYMRFGVGAGRTASLTWEALPPTVTLSLVRLR
ncbi:Ig-like domain-containing protein [Roseisolibacter agri]|uniref:Ig-like domain-containing protein n=1 Tax=Roseisolibacter agri TaxID=2014610 RepID=UPI0024E13EF5|nr:hypothetical protein [Roseisolibacter agri]